MRDVFAGFRSKAFQQMLNNGFIPLIRAVARFDALSLQPRLEEIPDSAAGELIPVGQGIKISQGLANGGFIKPADPGCSGCLFKLKGNAFGEALLGCAGRSEMSLAIRADERGKPIGLSRLFVNAGHTVGINSRITFKAVNTVHRCHKSQ